MSKLMVRMISTIMIVLLWPANAALAAGPGKGILEIHNIRVGRCTVKKMTIRYDLGSFFGEPTVKGSYKWIGNKDCRLPPSTILLLKVQKGNAWGYVRLAPSTPKANGNFGYNTTGSPSWSKLFCAYRGVKSHSCWTIKQAKRHWKSSSVTNALVHW